MIFLLLPVLWLSKPNLNAQEETFVQIRAIQGNQIEIAEEANAGGRGMGGRGGGGRGQLGGRGRGSADPRTAIINVTPDTKITSAMRERRTFEFRVGSEIPGGLRNDIFRTLDQPLSARVISENGRILEINIVTPQVDINQTRTDSDGKTIIAVRPKRPPTRRK